MQTPNDPELGWVAGSWSPADDMLVSAWPPAAVVFALETILCRILVGYSITLALYPAYAGCTSTARCSGGRQVA